MPKLRNIIIYGSNGKGTETRAVPAQDVELVPWLKTFIHRSHHFHEGKKTQADWIVSELRSGMSIHYGRRTRAVAIAEAREKLLSVGEANVLKTVEEKILQNKTEFTYDR